MRTRPRKMTWPTTMIGVMRITSRHRTGEGDPAAPSHVLWGPTTSNRVRDALWGQPRPMGFNHIQKGQRCPMGSTTSHGV